MCRRCSCRWPATGGKRRATGGPRPADEKRQATDSETDDKGTGTDGTISADTEAESAAEDTDSESGDEAIPAESCLRLGIGKRGPPQRERVWEDPWCYITHHPRYNDCKISIRRVFLKPTEMGRLWGSKALTPRHYGEDRTSPVRTHCLLRAWALWRARQFGWASRRDCRARQEAKVLAVLVAAIRLADGRRRIEEPLFGSEPAHVLCKRWAPDALRLVMEP